MGRIYGIVLAAGRGSRMNSDIPKQFMRLNGRPLLWYSLDAMQKSCVDDIVIATTDEYIGYVKSEIVTKYNLNKVKAVVAGGEQRYDSVWEGLKAIADIRSNETAIADVAMTSKEDARQGLEELPEKNVRQALEELPEKNAAHEEKQSVHGSASDGADIVLIHDGARPLVTPELIERLAKGARRYRACIPGVRLKDTVRYIGADGICGETPDRSLLRAVQTPQAFELELCMRAYEMLETVNFPKNGITDDAIVVETICGVRSHFIDGDNRNIKVTTPEDIAIAESLLMQGI